MSKILFLEKYWGDSANESTCSASLMTWAWSCTQVSTEGENFLQSCRTDWSAHVYTLRYALLYLNSHEHIHTHTHELTCLHIHTHHTHTHTQRVKLRNTGLDRYEEIGEFEQQKFSEWVRKFSKLTYFLFHPSPLLPPSLLPSFFLLSNFMHACVEKGMCQNMPIKSVGNSQESVTSW